MASNHVSKPEQQSGAGIPDDSGVAHSSEHVPEPDDESNADISLSADNSDPAHSFMSVSEPEDESGAGILLSPDDSGPAHASIELSLIVRLTHPIDADDDKYKHPEVSHLVDCLERHRIPVLHGVLAKRFFHSNLKMMLYMEQQRAKAAPFEPTVCVALKDYFWTVYPDPGLDDVDFFKPPGEKADSEASPSSCGRGVRLRSPLLQGDGWQSIRQICELLQNESGFTCGFDKPRTQLHIAMDRASLHTEYHEDYVLRLKKAALAFWYLEKVLVQLGDHDLVYILERRMMCATSVASKLYTKDRQEPMNGNLLSSLLKCAPRLWLGNRKPDRMDTYRKLGKIWAAQDAEDVAKAIDCFWGISSMLTTFEKAVGLFDMTMEPGFCEYLWVRMFQATLDADRIINLVQICVAGMELAKLEEPVFQRILTDIVMAPSILEIIAILGLGSKVDYWTNAVQKLGEAAAAEAKTKAARGRVEGADMEVEEITRPESSGEGDKADESQKMPEPDEPKEKQRSLLRREVRAEEM